MFPSKEGEYLVAVKNKNKEDGIWLYEVRYYVPDFGFEKGTIGEDILYWAEIVQLEIAPPKKPIKVQLKAVLLANGKYAGSSATAKLLRELADEWDD